MLVLIMMVLRLVVGLVLLVVGVERVVVDRSVHVVEPVPLA